MKRLFTSLFFFTLLTLSLSAQEGSWTHYFASTKAGDIDARGNDILVAPQGNGLVHYDALGNATHFHVSNSGIPSNDVKKVAIDASGNWWIYTENLITRYDGAAWESWTRSEIGLSASATITNIKSGPDGKVYVASTLGAAVYGNGSWSTVKTSNSGVPSDNIRDIAFGSDGKVYFATAAGLGIQDDANWTVINGTSTGIANLNVIVSVGVTQTGVIWVAAGAITASRKFYFFENGVWTELIPANIGLSSPGFASEVIVDQLDRTVLAFWFGVFIFSDGVWTAFIDTDFGCTIFPPVVTNPIIGAVDGAGQIWTNACNLTRFDGAAWEIVPTGNSALPAYNTNAISQDTEGNMWFATESGIVRYDGNTWTHFNPLDLGANIPGAHSIFGDPSGNVWAGLMVNSEILRYDGETWAYFDTCQALWPTIPSLVWTTAAAPNGDVWFSIVPQNTFGSRLARFSNENWTFFTPSNSPLPSGFSDMTAIAFTPDGIGWFGNAISGLFRYDGTAWETFNTSNSGLASDKIYDLAVAPDGALWACTDAGLSRYDGAGWTTLNASNSAIPYDQTYRIAFDGSGNLYLGFSSGSAPGVLSNGVWTELIPPSLETISSWPPVYALFVDSEDRLWFSLYLSSDVFVYDPTPPVSAEERAPAAFQIRAYPNPATGVVTLDLGAPLEKETPVWVSNMQGQLLRSAVLSGEQASVDLSGLPAGMYVVWVMGRGMVRVVKR
jgi:ligand-binding sensor domain-containing protein